MCRVLEEVVPLNPKNKEEKPNNRKENAGVLFLLIAAWYISSVVCTSSSKSLNLSWSILTACQMIISTICAWIGIRVCRLDGTGSPKLVPVKEATLSTIQLSAIFCAGFVTLNASIGMMHVSTVMTLRAAEPIATYLLSLALLPNESTSMAQVVSLLPICVGAGLSAIAKNDDNKSDTILGIVVVMVCNVCFALRTLLSKRLQARYKLDNFNLFMQLCFIGSMLQGMVWILLGGTIQDLQTISNIPLLLLNGITFYLYLQLSWVVISRVGAVTHSVCNALRRPVICAFGWLVFGGATLEGIVGVLIATLGTILYSRAKQRQGCNTKKVDVLDKSDNVSEHSVDSNKKQSV